MQESAGIVGSATDGNRTLLAIIDRCIGSITDQEITQITLDYTSSMEQEITFTDMLYRFRYPVITIALLVAAVIGLLVAFILMRRRNYRRLEINNVRLAAAVRDAQRANDAKSRFLARMSHEMRTPMNAIVGLTTLAQHAKETGGETVQGYLDKISVSSKMLLGMINDVLDMSAIESDKLKLIREKFSLKSQLEAIVYVYEAQCRGKDIAIELDRTHLVHERVIGDSLRLNQILLNLVSNAFKFTPAGGKITIFVEEIQPEAEERQKINYRISVTDTGEGISEEMMERLFMPFEQETADTAAHYGGSGLGLSIARNLAEYMGGDISCESKKGAGATFTLTIPLVVDESIEIGQGRSGQKMSDEPKERDITDFDFTGYTVLLAEDTKMSADILKDMFALCNLNLDWAENGAVAVDKFAASERGKYLAILMDVQMPVMDGYEATEAIRAMEREDAATIPIYAMTANAFEDDIEHAKRAGMTDHLTKPVDINALCEIIEKNTFC
jgi:signal transduction histidine kinase/CheY-like chemotaxis protein